MIGIQIKDGRSSLWQWDTGVVIRFRGNTQSDEVHFPTKSGIVRRPIVDGECEVPDIALQTAGRLSIYAYDRTESGGITRHEFKLNVNARPKPDNYVDPPEEADTLDAIAERAVELIKPDLNDLIEEIDPTVPDWAKEESKPTYTAEETGAVSETSEITATEISEIFSSIR